MRAPLENMCIRKTRQWPQIEMSRETMRCPCAKPMLAVPRPTSGWVALTARPRPFFRSSTPMSWASRRACFSPVWQTSNHPAGIVARFFLLAYALSKRFSPRRTHASVACACARRRAATASATSNSSPASSASKACCEIFSRWEVSQRRIRL